MQRIGKEAYLIILGVILLVFGSLALRTAQVKKSGVTEDTRDPSFAETRYPYRQLSDREQKLYNVLYKGIAAHQVMIHLPETYSGTEYERVYLMVMMQEPDFFYVDRVYEMGPELRDVKIIYTMTEDEAAEQKRRLDAAADRILSQISPVQTPWQQILTIHDAVAANCIYGMGLHSDDAVGCLADGVAMCEGYAKGFQYAARRAGFEMMCVPGRIGNGTDHVWNVVKIEGQYYNMDLTFDDDESYRGGIAHNCFAVPDAVFADDHLPDTLSFRPPACTDSSQTYYIKKGLVLTEPSQLAQHVLTWMNQQTDGVTEFYCAAGVTGVKSSLRNMPQLAGKSIYWDDVRRIALIV